MTKRNYVIIIGAMKSGTTTLFDILAKHPKIAPAFPKEPGFFAFKDIWDKGFDWFDTLFKFDPDRHEYRMEASTDYTKFPFIDRVWDRMTANPDVSVKLIYIMRHPLRRLESHARHVDIAKMELGKTITPQDSHSLDAGLSAVNIAASQYATQLAQYETAHAEGRLHCLTLEELKTAPEETLKAVYAFLDLEPVDEALEVRQSNTADSKRSINPTWHALLNIKPLVRIGKLILPRALRTKMHDMNKKPPKVTGRYKLNAEETAMLDTLYASERAALRDRYGIDIKTHWDYE